MIDEEFGTEIRTLLRRVWVFTGVVAGLSLLLGLPLWILWNLLIPPLFGGPVIGFWQAVGLQLLATLIFKGRG